jgi:hypothetical protein
MENGRDQRRYVRSNLVKLPGLAWILWQRTFFALLGRALDTIASYDNRTATAILAVLAWPSYVLYDEVGLTGLLTGLQGLGVVAGAMYWGVVVYRRGRGIKARPWPPPKERDRRGADG